MNPFVAIGIIVVVLGACILLTIHNDKKLREAGEVPEYIWNAKK